jgi:hypothetical protein
MEKKTISELYQECKHEQNLKQLVEHIEETTELFKEQLVKDFFDAPVRFGPSPIPPIPQSFQGKV